SPAFAPGEPKVPVDADGQHERGHVPANVGPPARLRVEPEPMPGQVVHQVVDGQELLQEVHPALAPSRRGAPGPLAGAAAANICPRASTTRRAKPGWSRRRWAVRSLTRAAWAASLTALPAARASSSASSADFREPPAIGGHGGTPPPPGVACRLAGRTGTP